MLPVQALPLHAVGRQNFSCSEPLAQSDYRYSVMPGELPPLIGANAYAARGCAPAPVA